MENLSDVFDICNCERSLDVNLRDVSNFLNVLLIFSNPLPISLAVLRIEYRDLDLIRSGLSINFLNNVIVSTLSKYCCIYSGVSIT